MERLRGMDHEFGDGGRNGGAVECFASTARARHAGRGPEHPSEKLTSRLTRPIRSFEASDDEIARILSQPGAGFRQETRRGSGPPGPRKTPVDEHLPDGCNLASSSAGGVVDRRSVMLTPPDLRDRRMFIAHDDTVGRAEERAEKIHRIESAIKILHASIRLT